MKPPLHVLVARRMRRLPPSLIILFIFAVLMLCASLPRHVSAAAGDLDPSFGSGGRAFHDFNVTASERDIRGIAIEPDGKFILSWQFYEPPSGATRYGLARLNADGSLDTTFGNGGVVRHNNGSGKVVIQADGKILQLSVNTLARYNADGSPDTSFGSGGLVASGSVGVALIIQPDQKILLAGASTSSSQSANSSFAVTRYNTDGSPDQSFGSVGTVVTTFTDTGRNIANAVALQPDGKIVAVGQTNSINSGDFAVARYNPDGSLDQSFGSGGKVTTNKTLVDIGLSVAVQPDGKILMGGLSGGFRLLRYNADGSLDTSFGTAGMVTIPVGGVGRYPVFVEVFVQSDSKIIYVGGADRIPDSNSDGAAWIVSRFNSDGAPDQTFGSGGRSEINNLGFFNVPTDALMQPDAKIVLAGKGFLSSDTVFSIKGLVVRFLNDITPTTLQFNQASYAVDEGAGSLTISVARSGNLSAPASVKYVTTDSTDVNFRCDPTTPNQTTVYASRKCDYHIASGTLRFAAGEAVKQFAISIVDDVYVEAPEAFTLTLSNPSGVALGQQINATITINDNDAYGMPNPIDQTGFFVRQLYVDLLSREPDPAGLNGWTTRIDRCGLPGQPPPPCDRVTVAGDGFLRSGEFFDRQFFVLRLYRTGLGRILRYDEIGDLAYVSGFLTVAELELNKQELVNEFVARPEFANQYNALNNTEFLLKLFETSGVTPQQNIQNEWISSLENQTKTRARVFREMSELPEVSAKYLHEAQVASAYYGFFTRNPDGAYLNYLQRLDSGEINLSDLANAFINAAEYRSRFGQ